MSLINDALKKAQRDRSGHAGASIEPVVQSGPVPPQAYHHRPAQGGSGGMGRGILVGAAIVLALVGGGAAVWLLKPSAPTGKPAVVAAAPSPAPTAPTPPPAARAPEPTPTAAPVRTAPSIPPASVPATTATTSPPVSTTPTAPTASPVVAAPAPPPAPRPTSPEPFQIHLNLPATASPTPEAPTTSPEPTAVAPAAPDTGGFQIRLKLDDPRILAFLDSARINGIRAAADDAKLLMNNRVFKTGDIVDRGLSLKLIKIEPGKLTFEDGQGKIYVKLF